jgi:RNA recognition motif-containing protein
MLFYDFDNCIFSIKLPYQAGWQDLKDLFRTAGSIVRADINIGVDGRPKGSGTVVFETPKDAQQAISASLKFFNRFLFSSSPGTMLTFSQACTTVSIGTVVRSKFGRFVCLLFFCSFDPYAITGSLRRPFWSWRFPWRFPRWLPGLWWAPRWI